MRLPITASALAVCFGFLAAIARADESQPSHPQNSTQQLNGETVLTGLNRPCAIAIRPETEYVYMAEAGAGQIVKYAPDKPNTTTPVVTDFPQRTPTSTPAYQGLWGLAFFGRDALALLNINANDKEEAFIGIVDLPTVGSAKDAQSVKYDSSSRRLTRVPTVESKSRQPISGFSLALSDFAIQTLFVAERRQDELIGVFKGEVNNHSSLSGINALIKSTSPNELPLPLCMAINPHGLLVMVEQTAVAQNAASDQPAKTSLTFYNPKNGNSLMSLPLKLHGVIAMAFSPESGRLYALKTDAAHPVDDGVYRLDTATNDGRDTVKATRITPLECPTALAFSPESNTLYVTTMVSGGADSNVHESNTAESKTESGKLIKITGDL